jgi:hypothetical protein
MILFFFFAQPLTKEKAKNRTFANELGSRLQSAVNGNKSGTLRKRPTNDDTRELNFNFDAFRFYYSVRLSILFIFSFVTKKRRVCICCIFKQK